MEVSPHPAALGPVEVQLFSSAPSDRRARRPVDALRALGYGLLVLVAAILSETGGDLDASFSEVLTSFPGFLEVLWLSGYWLALAWALGLMAITTLRGRWSLALAAAGSAVLALGIAVGAAALVNGEAGDVVGRLVDTDGPPSFPPAVLAITSAVFATTAPYVTVPFRRVGRALVAAQMAGALFLGAAEALGAVASLAIGLLAGSTMHLLRGSPGGFPTVTRVLGALADLGVGVDDLAPTMMRKDGVAVLTGADPHGEIEVRVYGRDAWEGGLLADLWRLAWYRGRRRTARVSRTEYVEHEGFMTMLAARGGVRVPDVVTAGLADNGDALIAVRPDGTQLDAVDAGLSPEQVRSLWEQLGRLHACRITHHRLDLDRIVVRGPAAAGFSDLSLATAQASEVDALVDRAQLLALTTATAGADVAVEGALSALGRAGLTAVLPYLQESSVPPLARSALRHGNVDLDTIRSDLARRLGVEDIELIELRRVTVKSLLNIGLFAVATYALIGLIGGLDLDAFGRALADASGWWLLAALLIGQAPRLADAVSTMGSTPQSLPFGPTAALQFAKCYVSLAVPTAAGRVALTTRFFERFGVPPVAALSAGVIDSVSEFLVQLALFVLVFFASDLDLEPSLSLDELSGVATTALIVLAALAVGGAVALAVPSVRRRVAGWLREASGALQVMRSPRKLLQMYGGNLLSQVLFAVSLAACVRAFGFEVPLSSLILINTAVSLFAGLVPVPGGVGVSEAGLSLGLTTAGVPSETAFAIALTYRFVTFYLPPIWGLRSYRWMRSRRYL